MYRELRISCNCCCGRSATLAAVAKTPAHHCGCVSSHRTCRRLQVGHPSRLFVWDFRLVKGAIGSPPLLLNKWLQCQRMNVYRRSEGHSTSEIRLKYILGSAAHREWINKCVNRTSCVVKYHQIKICGGTRSRCSTCRTGPTRGTIQRMLCQSSSPGFPRALFSLLGFVTFEMHRRVSVRMPPTLAYAELENPCTQVEHLLAWG
jgi:hypothetical protein